MWGVLLRDGGSWSKEYSGYARSMRKTRITAVIYSHAGESRMKIIEFGSPIASISELHQPEQSRHPERSLPKLCKDEYHAAGTHCLDNLHHVIGQAAAA